MVNKNGKKKKGKTMFSHEVVRECLLGGKWNKFVEVVLKTSELNFPFFVKGAFLPLQKYSSLSLLNSGSIFFG